MVKVWVEGPGFRCLGVRNSVDSRWHDDPRRHDGSVTYRHTTEILKRNGQLFVTALSSRRACDMTRVTAAPSRRHTDGMDASDRTVVAVVLAGGAGSRFIGDHEAAHKLDALLRATSTEREESVADRAIRHATEASIGPVIIVAGGWSPASDDRDGGSRPVTSSSMTAGETGRSAPSTPGSWPPPNGEPTGWSSGSPISRS